MLPKSEKDLKSEKLGQGEGQMQARQSSPVPSPWAQMDRLFDEMFKRPFFSLLSPRLSGEEAETLYLPVDIFEDGESVVVKAEMPGIKKEDLNVQLTPDTITISGKKSSEERAERKDYYRVERSWGSFSRTCHLPSEILTDKARATFKDGVLEVRIPKSEQAAQRSRKLNIE
jgi:HSP20 family protein